MEGNWPKSTIPGMKFPFRHAFLLAALALTACATPPTAPPAHVAAMPITSSAVPRPVPLLLISIDAYRADYLQRQLSPTLEMLAAHGVRAEAMQPSFPSLTFPNHYTLVTGLYPDHHGIVANDMYDPVLGAFSIHDRKARNDPRWWDEATPIWVTADAHGLRTATMFWPGSEAPIHGRYPDQWLPYDGKITPDQRVDQVLAWLDEPPAQRPDFITLYFDRVDHAGHDFGPDSPQLDAALRQNDAALARLVAGLKARGLFDRINIIVVSDHGMASVPREHTVLLDRLFPVDAVRVVALGPVAELDPRSATAADQAAFAGIEARLIAPQQHMQCWDKTHIPARLHYGSNPRVPQLVCMAEVGWRIETQEQIARRGKPASIGDHGYDNAAPSMRALFIAEGPSFRSGLVVPEFPNVDVYPLMLHLLGLPPQHADGDYDAVAPMLRPAAR